MTQEKINDPKIIKSVEGRTNNCLNEYTNFGKYLNKYKKTQFFK